MFNNTTQPLYADFNETDEDGAVIMHPDFIDMHLVKTDFVPRRGAKVWISDGDVEETGTLAFRDKGTYKYWVAVTEKGSIKDVPKNAWYHNDSLQKK